MFNFNLILAFGDYFAWDVDLGMSACNAASPIILSEMTMETEQILEMLLISCYFGSLLGQIIFGYGEGRFVLFAMG